MSAEHNPFDSEEDGTWFDEQQSFERNHPRIAENISEFRDWLMTAPGQDWLVEQLRLTRFRPQRRSLRARLGQLP